MHHKDFPIGPDGRVECFSHVDGKVRRNVLYPVDFYQQAGAGCRFYHSEQEAKAAESQGLIPAAGTAKPPFSDFEAADPGEGSNSGDGASDPKGASAPGADSKAPAIPVGPIKKS